MSATTLSPMMTPFLSDDCGDWCLTTAMASTMASAMATTQLPNATAERHEFGESKLVTGFTSTILVILASELGDKTFFLTTLMAMKHSKQLVFFGALTAALVMITLTIALGLVTTFIPKYITHYIALFLFIIFGFQMLIEGFLVPPEMGIEDALKSMSVEEAKAGPCNQWILKIKTRFRQYFSLIFVESFALRFFAEWGDRSQIALILLAARENIVGMVIGATVGHIICLLLAVIGGGIIAKVVSPRSVNMIGGWVFLGVAVHSSLKGPES